jgi:hypothetical protein
MGSTERGFGRNVGFIGVGVLLEDWKRQYDTIS